MSSFVISMASAVLYGWAGGCFAHESVKGFARRPLIARLAFLAAFLLHSASIGIDSAASSGTVLEGSNVIMLASWVLSTVSLAVLVACRRPQGYLAVSAFIAAMLILFSHAVSAACNGAVHQTGAYDRWPVLALHITAFLASLSCFAIAAAASGMVLYQLHLMRRRDDVLLHVSMPSLDVLESTSRRFCAAGLVLFTAGMAIGLGRYAPQGLFAQASDGLASLSYLAPRIGASAALWVLFAALAVVSYAAPYALAAKTRCVLLLVAFAGSLALMLLATW